MVNIILCGGSGTRLWPLSRTLMPKQFVKLFGKHSLFQETVSRNRSIALASLVVTNQEHYFIAHDQMEEIGCRSDTSYLLEPAGRNTAPAIALACMELEPETLVLVTPSDHLVKDQAAYEKVLSRAEELAQEGFLVTFGITPGYPETGYGYIEARGEEVAAFHEKPDFETAQRYLEAGRYLWNSGMFCFKAGTFLDELSKHAPEIFEASQAAHSCARREGMIRITPEAMAAIPEESIDYAVMERSGNVKVVACEIGWNDIGSFDALDQELAKDGDGNTLCDRHISEGSKNNLVIASDRTVATVDVEDMIIIDTPDALLISRKGSSQKIKEVVKRLKKTDPDLASTPLTVYRPWGTYTILEDHAGYKIKTIVVKPGQRLSLQKHYHRSEHWVVLSGTAKVTVNDTVTLVRPNESTYIPIGAKHRLENEGRIDLVIIEAQVGEYTGEDDIVRFDDDYKREDR